jgi:hypothetical protein
MQGRRVLVTLHASSDMATLAKLTACLALAAATAAQELRWNLPAHGAAIYQRTWYKEVQSEPKGSQDNVPGLDEIQAPCVLADELDDKQKRPTEPVHHMRGLFPALALDLSVLKPSPAKIELHHQLRNAVSRAEVVYGPLSASGEQTIEVTLGPGPKEKVALADNPFDPRIRGKISGTRTLDRSNGRVSSFSYTLDLLYEFNKGDGRPLRRATVKASESWTFSKTIAHEDAEFRSMVTAGIRKAVAALRKELERQLGEAPATSGDLHFNTQAGELALKLLALVKGGEDPREPLIAKAYADLRTRKIEGTYSLACAILAIEALYTPPSEAQELREGRLKAPIPRSLSEADKKVVAEWTKTLLGNIDDRVDEKGLRRWFYGPGSDFDNSNTQYALLGLFAAQLCGIEVPAVIWTAAANHWLRVRLASGEPGAPKLTSHADLEKDPKGKTRATGTKVTAYGWSYKSDGEATGSMTCAGVTGLTLSSAALRALKKSPLKLQQEIDETLRGALLWLERNVSVRRNPGPPHAWSSWHFYYLYGLERACELNQVALLGDTDWYFDGAMELLLRQGEDGRWMSDNDTCFGLLFLKKTALPAVTR